MPNKHITPEMVALARQFRKQPTPAEEKTWELLRDRRCLGLKFKRQRIVEGFYVDFYCYKLRLVLEIDGAIHDEPMQAQHDAVRTQYLEAAGYRVARLPNEKVSEEELRCLLQPLLPLSRGGHSPTVGEGAGG